MRLAPSAAALSLALALTASGVFAAPRAPDPRAQALLAEGQSALRAGDAQGAVDAFEAALALDPGHTPTLLRLAEAARASDLQGKAIHYYREALAREPGNLEALAGEGVALAEKGALAKARERLAALEKACGKASCAPAQVLSAAIAKGPVARVQTAEVKLPDVQPAQVN
ncbi:tetratricopeptide repeat protein [Qipengyuania sediminis]|uniref:tetratricopeptide repeat protein n=1 Tax=Qipengyuania sediminis TaxID=1532023 RepID=UPI00105A5246|nr:tetratricopeptide repeat protein [Qipengyuania sediminis]